MTERGRPREFDTDAALDKAIEVFWRYGYEGASMSRLTDAMGIHRPSVYAAFGTKGELFRGAVRRYAETDMAYAAVATSRPTAVEVAEEFLTAHATAVTRDDRPHGCLSLQGGLSAGPDSGGIAEFLAESRLTGERLFAERFARAIADGDLIAGTDPAALARYLMAVSEGHAVHAAAGVDRADLLASVSIALTAFSAVTSCAP